MKTNIFLAAALLCMMPYKADAQGTEINNRDHRGEVIDLGGREIEVIFTPGHTAGSATFFDKAKHYGFSGDAFGSTNLLVFTNLSTEMYQLQ